MRDFTKLKVWQKGHELVLLVYKITSNFPKEEKYSLVDQMRRVAVSITSNIAEGFGRRSWKDKVKFYTMASGSLIELRNQFYIARDVGYLNSVRFDKLMSLSVVVSKLIGGLIRGAKVKGKI